jgi:hypothetical protein
MLWLFGFVHEKYLHPILVSEKIMPPMPEGLDEVIIPLLGDNPFRKLALMDD